MTLEQAMEFIDDDELVEVTPESIRPASARCAIMSGVVRRGREA